MRPAPSGAVRLWERQSKGSRGSPPSRQLPLSVAAPGRTSTRLGQIDAAVLKLLEERAALVVQAAGERKPRRRRGSIRTCSKASWKTARVCCRNAPCVPSSARSRAAAARWSSQTRIAFLGPLLQLQPSGGHPTIRQRACSWCRSGTISAVFEEVHRGQADFGLVPVENSTDGRIADTLDMFTRLPVRICGQVEMPIHHCAAGQMPRTEVKEVYSRPQADQPMPQLAGQALPAARTIEVTSTSTAAQLAAEKPGAAAIASPQAGVEYGLSVLAENIEDNPGNTHAVRGHRRARSGADRQRPHGDAVSGRASPRHVGRRDEHLQAKQAEPDVDRIVSRPRRRRGVTCFLWRWRGTRATCACGGRWRRWSVRRCDWRFSARFRSRPGGIRRAGQGPTGSIGDNSVR